MRLIIGDYTKCYFTGVGNHMLLHQEHDWHAQGLFLLELPAGRNLCTAASSTRGVFFGGRLNPDTQTAEIKYIEMGTIQ